MDEMSQSKVDVTRRGSLMRQLCNQQVLGSAEVGRIEGEFRCFGVDRVGRAAPTMGRMTKHPFARLRAEAIAQLR